MVHIKAVGNHMTGNKQYKEQVDVVLHGMDNCSGNLQEFFDIDGPYHRRPLTPATYSCVKTPGFGFSLTRVWTSNQPTRQLQDCNVEPSCCSVMQISINLHQSRGYEPYRITQVRTQASSFFLGVKDKITYMQHHQPVVPASTGSRRTRCNTTSRFNTQSTVDMVGCTLKPLA